MSKQKDTVSLISEKSTPPTTTTLKPSPNSTTTTTSSPKKWPTIKRTLELLPIEEREKILKRKQSLSIPPDDPIESNGQVRRSSSVVSRRESSRSNESHVSAIDFSKLENNGQKKEDEDEKIQTTNTTDSYIRMAIPYLPLPVAVLCLLFNIIIPGSGTMLSGLCLFCCGKSRLGTKDDTKMSVVCTNMCIGVSQLFTVTFLLVGWFWSFTWGIYIVILAAEYSKEQKVKRDKQLQAMAITAFGSPTIRPWSLK